MENGSNASSTNNGAGGNTAVMKVKAMSGDDWALQLVKKLEGDKGSAVSLMKQKGRYYVVTRELATSGSQLPLLVKEVAAWKLSCKLCMEALVPIGGASGILNLYDCVVLSKNAGNAKDGVMFISEYCAIGRLSNWISSRTQQKVELSAHVILKIASDITTALHFFYESGGILHGNVTPDSVYLLGEEAAPCAKLGGFGLSRIQRLADLDEKALKNEQEKTGESGKRDVFLVGCLLYFMAVGSIPEELEIMAKDQLLGEKIEESPKLPKSGLMRDDVRRITKMCLERKERNRPSIEELKTELLSAIGFLPSDQNGEAEDEETTETPKRRSSSATPNLALTSPQSQTEALGSVERKKLSKNASPAGGVQSPSPVKNSTVVDDSRAARSLGLNFDDNAIVAIQNANSALPGISETEKGESIENDGTEHKLKRNRNMEANVNKATEVSREAPSSKQLRVILLDVQETKMGGVELYQAMYKRPIPKSPAIAFKVFGLVHKVLIEGPPSFLETCRKQHKFFDWIASVWSKERVDAFAMTKKASAGLANGFMSDEVGLYARILQAKIKFHVDFQDAFEPNWSRRVIKTDGTDPLTGKKHTLISRILALMESIGRFIHCLLSGKDDCRPCKVWVIPSLIFELSKAYSAVCVLLETVEKEERKRLMPEFAACHYAARAGLEDVMADASVSELCRPDILVRLDAEPPSIVPRSVRGNVSPASNALVVRKSEPSKDEVKQLVANLAGMGFPEKEAKKALKKAGYNMEMAVEFLAPQSVRPRRNSINTEDAPSSNTSRVEYEDLTRPETKVRGSKKSLRRDQLPESASESSDSEDDEESSAEDATSSGSRRKKMSTVQNRRNSAPSAKPRKAQSSSDSASDSEDSHDFRRKSSRSKSKKSSSKLKDSVKMDSKVVSKRNAFSKNLIPPKEARKLVKAALQGYVDPNIEVEYESIQMGMQLGQGGFGTVYKGIYRGETIAVKKIHSNALQNKKSIEEFKREVAVLCALRHPNILSFLGACTRPPNLAIVTEFCAHGTLFDVLHKETKPITWPFIHKFALETCRGILYLHESGLLHRDLKSSNLLLDAQYNVKVGDFGLARLGANDATAVQMTGQCGTFQYMAPEVMSSRPYSEKADVFSYGILVWELCARKLPYFGMEPMQVGLAVVNQKLRPAIPPSVPPQFVEIMKVCWHQDPNRRPNLHQVEQALLNFRM